MNVTFSPPSFVAHFPVFSTRAMGMAESFKYTENLIKVI